MTTQQMTRDQYRHWLTIEVRWGDMDAMGHVNNTVYFTYFESARISLLGKSDIRARYADSRQGPVLVSTSGDFKRQVVFPATLDIGLRVTKIGHRSFHMEYGVFFHGTDELVAVGRSINAWVDYAAGKAVPLPDDLRVELAKYQSG